MVKSQVISRNPNSLYKSLQDKIQAFEEIIHQLSQGKSDGNILKILEGINALKHQIENTARLEIDVFHPLKVQSQMQGLRYFDPWIIHNQPEVRPLQANGSINQTRKRGTLQKKSVDGGWN